MTAVNILWDVDFDDVLEYIFEKPIFEAAEILGISNGRYADMTIDERQDFIHARLLEDPDRQYEILGLPLEVEIPDNITDLDDVADWLTETYGYCHGGFEIE